MRLGALYFLVAGAGAAAREARTKGRCRVEVEGRVAGTGEAAGEARAQAGAERLLGWKVEGPRYFRGARRQARMVQG